MVLRDARPGRSVHLRYIKQEDTLNFLGWTIIRAKSLARIHERNKALDKEIRKLESELFDAHVALKRREMFPPGWELV
jgi:cell division protein FtsB